MGHPQEAVHLTQSLLRFNTINPPGEEEACAQHIGRMLEAAGFKVVYHALGRGRASLVATIGG
ncbi:MAG: peptidase M20, partial [Burkholderiales bacterium]|nr:peptidase M20 [Burkholderiales bacterium]